LRGRCDAPIGDSGEGQTTSRFGADMSEDEVLDATKQIGTIAAGRL
jgi:hypothetical protein